jgi:hypothetical protein
MITASDAKVTLKTRAGKLVRDVKHTDSTGEVMHFSLQDSSGMKADLSVNSYTDEFFYTERGVMNGKPYLVKSHGWLKKGWGHTEHPAKVASANPMPAPVTAPVAQ